MSAITSIAKLLQKVPQVMRTRQGAAATGVGLGAALVGGDDLVGMLPGFGKKRRRRMNYGNAKAARRAIRRIKGTRKLLQDIEKQMPRRPAPRPRRDLGKDHTHVR